MAKRGRGWMLAISILAATLGLNAFAAPANAEASIDFVKLHQNPSFCWDDPTAQTDLILWQCNGSTHQKWRVIFTPRGDLPGTFLYQNVSSGLCIDAAAGGGAQQSPIKVTSCNFASAAQNFVVDYAFNDGHWHQAWRNEFTGMCMDLFGGIANGKKIVNWPCNRTPAQLWRFVNV